MSKTKFHLTLIGATSELGIALAYAFGPIATHLHLCARQVERLEPLQKDMLTRGLFQDVYLHELDIEKYQPVQIKALAEQTDLVITTAGYLADQRMAETQEEEAQRMLIVNFTGLVQILDVFVQSFQQRNQGGIIGISSVAGERGRQSNYYYGSAKAGFSAYLSGLRNRLFKHHVHVMTVKPGFLYTRMTAGMDLPGALTATPEAAAKGIFKAWQRKQNIYYHKWMWRWVMLVIKCIPEGVFKRMKL